MEVSVLFGHGARPGGRWQRLTRLCQANLADRFAQVEFRCGVRSQCEPGSTTRTRVAIVMHNYSWRPDLAEGEAEYADLEKWLAAQEAILNVANSGKFSSSRSIGEYASQISGR